MGEGFIGDEDHVNDQDLVIFPRRDELPEDNSRGQYFPTPQMLLNRESSQLKGASWSDEHISAGFFPETARTHPNDTLSSSFAAFSNFGPDLLRDPSSSDVTFSDGEFDSNNHDCETIATKSCSSDEACSCNGLYHCVIGRCALKSTQLPSYTPLGIWGEAIPFD
ncbi:unnamed protein product [Lymnaea stagnalis]|uniref:Uncharacterized protein n=1 Tax=Lymnaea stagnalis TaxID=6523 RepID=A0AAV2HA32_LYMST